MNTKKIAVLMIMLATIFSISTPALAKKKVNMVQTCSIPVSAINVKVDPFGVISWQNNTTIDGYNIVERSVLVDAHFYDSPLYYFWTDFTPISSQLSLGTVSYLDQNPVIGYKTKYRVVTYNSCGEKVSSVGVGL